MQAVGEFSHPLQLVYPHHLRDYGYSRLPARLSRNLASAQGRTDFVRVRLVRRDGRWWAEPVLGKSGLLNTMIASDGLVEVPKNVEGLDEGAPVDVILFD